MSKLERLEQITTWKRALNAARKTIGKNPLSHEPSGAWESKMILAEHSPIRLVEYDWSWSEIKTWVTAHLVRHHEGCEKFVHSQRTDRRDMPEGVETRDDLPQGSLNEMDMTANVQAIINISRKRLCSCASQETREAWGQVIEGIEKVDPILASKCVPECLYRGFCPEFMGSCGYSGSTSFKKRLVEYRRPYEELIWKDVPGRPGIQIAQNGRLHDFAANLELVTKEDEYGNLHWGELYPAVLVYFLYCDRTADITLESLTPEMIKHKDGNRINCWPDNLCLKD
jgi:hypothetical protein